LLVHPHRHRTITMAENKDLLASIEKGAPLKHAETKDTSAPVVEGVTVKKVDRTPFLNEVSGGVVELKHVEPVHDASAPKIEGDVHVKTVDRAGFLKSVEEAAKK